MLLILCDLHLPGLATGHVHFSNPIPRLILLKPCFAFHGHTQLVETSSVLYLPLILFSGSRDELPF